MKNFEKVSLMIIIAVTAALVLTGCFGVNKINNVADDSAIDENAPNTESPAVPFPWGGNNSSIYYMLS